MEQSLWYVLLRAGGAVGRLGSQPNKVFSLLNELQNHSYRIFLVYGNSDVYDNNPFFE